MPIAIPNDEEASDLAKLTSWILQATNPVVECPVELISQDLFSKESLFIRLWFLLQSWL